MGREIAPSATLAHACAIAKCVSLESTPARIGRTIDVDSVEAKRIEAETTD